MSHPSGWDIKTSVTLLDSVEILAFIAFIIETLFSEQSQKQRFWRRRGVF